MQLQGGIDTMTWSEHAWRNRIQSLVLLASMALFLAVLGWLIWGPAGILILVTLGILVALINPVVSPQLIMRLYGARPLAPRQMPVLWAALEQLAVRAELPNRPVLYYVPSSMLNAFAVGARENAAIAVTDGLLRRLDLREVVGVMAHEVSHIRNNDLWVMGLADLFSRTTSLISLLGQFLLLLNLPLILFSEVTISWFAILLLIFAPTLSALAQMALSRTREYDADLNAVRLTGDPEGLAHALAKIERVQGGWMERIFMPGRRIPEPSLLRTHPPMEERIRRLLELRRFGIRQPISIPERPMLPLDEFGARVIQRLPRWHITGLWY